ncbi:MAG TPA: cbb3-type cytochrome c oxidase N-terminal domain-containing protein [Chryseosolibacter sp.]|nr:cbb3-type cytochrome c oxidase N-terminal domain-containing protein [Chryseosolibacter sp.]
MKKTYLTLVASGLSFATVAQSTEPSGGNILNDPLLPLYITGTAVIILLVLVLLVTIYVIRTLNYLTKEATAQNAVQHGVSVVQPKTWWQNFVQKMNASVPVEQEHEIEMEHSYDGIRELDNHLPPWWKWLFYGSMAWAVVYFFLFHVSSSLPLSLEEYTRELALAEEEVRKHQASQPQSDVDENSLTFTADAAMIEKGKTVFTNNNCGGCHRTDGGGNSIGPNLTDEYWLHGGEVKNIFQTIKNGVVEKGMPAWGKSMSPQDVRDVTFFVMSLQGTNPPDAKAPQGEIFKQVNTRPDSAQTQAGL